MQGNDVKTNSSPGEKRPRSITLLSIATLSFSLFYLLEFWQVVNQWETLSSLPLLISPKFQAVEGLFWSISGLLLTWGLWKGKGWAPSTTIAASLMIMVFSWIKLIWVFNPAVLTSRWPITLAFSILGPGILLFILTRKSTRAYFGKNAVKIP